MIKQLCFGCRHLVFTENTEMTTGWWTCPNVPDVKLGVLGKTELSSLCVCVPPVRECVDKYEYYPS
jgi:hypothetical protein